MDIWHKITSSPSYDIGPKTPLLDRKSRDSSAPVKQDDAPEPRGPRYAAASSAPPARPIAQASQSSESASFTPAVGAKSYCCEFPVTGSAPPFAFTLEIPMPGYDLEKELIENGEIRKEWERRIFSTAIDTSGDNVKQHAKTPTSMLEDAGARAFFTNHWDNGRIPLHILDRLASLWSNAQSRSNSMFYDGPAFGPAQSVPKQVHARLGFFDRLFVDKEIEDAHPAISDPQAAKPKESKASVSASRTGFNASALESPALSQTTPEQAPSPVKRE